ncbi:hypothetical protein DACRYDRAFT_47361, partial [Dacryopinax primogenitus]
FHPRFITTAGLEDFETNEWISSKQNLTVSLFQHASEYHQHATLHVFWLQWDEDHCAGLDWLLGNYWQALMTLDTYATALGKLQQELGIADHDFPNFVQEECKYFQNLQHKPEHNVVAFKYLETLKSSQVTRYKCQLVTTWHLLSEQVRWQMLECDHLAAIKAEERLEAPICQYETILDTAHWTPNCEEWQHTEVDLANQAYNDALDELESLIVQRLFEMEKRNL